MQCPPTSPGSKGRKFHFVFDASSTSQMDTPALAKICVTSFMKAMRSEEHTSELQSRQYLVCRLLLAKKHLLLLHLLSWLSSPSSLSLLLPLLSTTPSLSLRSLFPPRPAPLHSSPLPTPSTVHSLSSP